ncbi:MAG: hypothetical protein A2527_04330 [Candidatus Lambdaproteobacteria bacterium RIFOXYD2_FULL_50_16]|uniref:SxtJ n=1 Tax=Candidatus Lambdaproteobacteria bacterium RIFOXYD2_FULL_50_16 TaxID=1817772 RepID=A0A1F6G4D0_9PROT|nr:MAG: hypothetical protein A2527_04330 [Candidatus Lambdaproteobacteria bacterium RIFOXYD2_FULL_50_16]
MKLHPIPELDQKGLRNFGVKTGAIVAFLFGGLLPFLLSTSFPLWPWVIAGPLILFGLIWPTALGPVYKGWMTFGAIAGAINSKIILGIVYYLLIVPVGLGMRLFGRDPMKRHKTSSTSSNWDKSLEVNPKHYERPY